MLKYIYHANSNKKSQYNKIVKTFDEMTESAVYDAVGQADETFRRWRKTTYKQRADLMHKVASQMRNRKESLAKLITLEMGKLISQAEAEIDLSANIIDYYADNGEKFLADQLLIPAYGKAFIRYTPLGVVFGVEPWNFPFYQVARFAGPNIMAGNTVLIKHASIVPQCGIAIEDLFSAAGAPKGLYTNLLMSRKRASALWVRCLYIHERHRKGQTGG
jgi:succinate-semialdehyde dehydrogenase/glutarate-semialdehyde dehydrogenase